MNTELLRNAIAVSVITAASMIPSAFAQCDSAEIPGATLAVAAQGTPPFLLTDYLSGGECFREYRTRADAHAISSGHYFARKEDPAHGGGPTPYEGFIEKTISQIESKLQTHIQNELGWTNDENLTYSGIITIDIENQANPTQITQRFAELAVHPNYTFADLQGYWSRCIQATRNKFPCATILWWGIGSPNLTGNPFDPGVTDGRIQLWAETLENFDFTDLDGLASRHYAGFGPDDFASTALLKARYENIANAGATNFDNIIDYPVSGPYSRDHLKFAPHFSLLIYNGSSAHEAEYLLDSGVDPTLEHTLIPQFDIVEAHPDHLVSVIWTPQTYHQGASLPGASFNIKDHLVLLRCLLDYDGNGTRDFFDFTTFQNYFDVESSCADLNRDATVDIFDYLMALDAMGEGDCPN